MAISMTGFGAATLETEQLSITVEIRSLNSKFLDISYRLPKQFADKEIEIKNLFTDRFERGKVSFMLSFQQVDGDQPKVRYNEVLFQRYYEELEKLANAVGADKKDLYRLAVQSPDVITNVEADEASEEHWAKIKGVVLEAIDHCVDFRQQEGDALTAKLISYIEAIGDGLEQVKALEPQRAERVRERLQGHMGEIAKSEQFDKNRFEQEIIYYIEKLDINEEIVRLGNHLSYFTETINSDKSSVGKKLGFISQEIGREINTIGSKANDAQIQRIVVGMKEELEKIKEQTLNIL